MAFNFFALSATLRENSYGPALTRVGGSGSPFDDWCDSVLYPFQLKVQNQPKLQLGQHQMGAPWFP